MDGYPTATVPTAKGGPAPGGIQVQGLLRVKSAAQVQQAANAAPAVPSIIYPAITGHLNTVWRRNLEAKSQIEARMLDAIRRRRGEYSPEKLAEIQKQGGAVIFLKYPELKCNHAEAWIMDVLAQADNKTWTMGPTPVADLPRQDIDDIVQQVMAGTVEELNRTGNTPSLGDVRAMALVMRDRVLADTQRKAKSCAERMESVIDDQMREGGWGVAFREMVTDLVTVGTGIIKGPIVRRELRLIWGDDGKPQVSEEMILRWERVNPLDLYPSPRSTDIDDGDLFERRLYEAHELVGLKDVVGYNSDAIDRVLERFGSGGMYEPVYTDSVQASLAYQSATYERDGRIECREFSGRLMGKLLLDWGMKGVQPNKSYDCKAKIIGNEVIYCVLNPHPLGKRGYAKAVYRPIPGSFWGEGVPMLMSATTDMVNAAARALCNNMGLSSGPQVVVDLSRVAEGEGMQGLKAWRLWFTTPGEPGITYQGKPVEFHEIESHVEEFILVIDKFSPQADAETGVPAYTYGSDSTAGAGKTAAGLSMLLSTAARGIKLAILSIDNGCTERHVELAYVHNMLYHPRADIKGDLRVVPQGAMGLFLREQKAIRLQEFTQFVANDPTALQIVGVKRYARLLREVARVQDIGSVDKFVPTDDEVELEQATAAAAAAGAMPPGGAGPGAPGPEEMAESDLLLERAA